MKAEKDKVDTLIAVAPNTWREMHQSLFIFLPKNSEYVIYGDKKQRSLDQQAQQVVSNDTKKVTCL